MDGVDAGAERHYHRGVLRSFVERRSADTKKYVIAFFALLAVVISLLTVFIAHLSWRGWMNGVGGCPNVGGVCIGCTMPGFPDKFMPFGEEPPGAKMSTDS